jgi:hypothetical protein
MKKILITVSILFYASYAFSQVKKETEKIQIVEASCGQCNFGMAGNSCDLAIKIKGKAYFVDGTKIDEHGDAHAKDGFCMAIKKAEVKGEIVGERFLVSYFKVIEENKTPN